MKRIITIILSAIMCMGIFTACAEQEKTQQTDDGVVLEITEETQKELDEMESTTRENAELIIQKPVLVFRSAEREEIQELEMSKEDASVEKVVRELEKSLELNIEINDIIIKEDSVYISFANGSYPVKSYHGQRENAKYIFTDDMARERFVLSSFYETIYVNYGLTTHFSANQQNVTLLSTEIGNYVPYIPVNAPANNEEIIENNKYVTVIVQGLNEYWEYKHFVDKDISYEEYLNIVLEELGEKASINSVKVEKDSMYIDLDSAFAPFNSASKFIDRKYTDGESKAQESLEILFFNTIKKSVEAEYNIKNVYFTVDSGCSVQLESFEIGMDNPYEGLKD